MPPPLRSQEFRASLGGWEIVKVACRSPPIAEIFFDARRTKPGLLPRAKPLTAMNGLFNTIPARDRRISASKRFALAGAGLGGLFNLVL